MLGLVSLGMKPDFSCAALDVFVYKMSFFLTFLIWSIALALDLNLFKNRRRIPLLRSKSIWKHILYGVISFFVGVIVMGNIEGLHSDEYKALYEAHNIAEQQEVLGDDRQIQTEVATLQSNVNVVHNDVVDDIEEVKKVENEKIETQQPEQGTSDSNILSDDAQNIDEAKDETFSEVNNYSSDNKDTLEVHFIDVGQGDCTLIKYGEHAMLIDAGPDAKGTAVQLYLTKQNIKTLDYILLTHYDEDHAGGADVILTKFDCDIVILPQYKTDTKTYNNVIDTMAYRNYRSTTPYVGDVYPLGAATFSILSVGDKYADDNNQSICIRVDYENDSFIFTGDADTTVENKMINSGANLSADVFQVGHHGSKHSNSSAFISKVAPTYAVISCGKDNSYGHPTSEALNNLRNNNVQVFRTDEQGTVIAYSNGNGITWNTGVSITWQAGDVNVSDYSNNTETGSSVENSTAAIEDIPTVVETPAVVEPQTTYILNTNTKKFHYPSCKSVNQMKEKNKQAVTWTREEVIAAGYDSCGNCHP